MSRQTPTATSRRPVPRAASSGCWVEPGTHQVYPTSFVAYRRMREAQEKPLPRHRTLGPDVERHVWRRWSQPAAPDIDVLLTLRPGSSPRIRRFVAEVLRAIRRGQRAVVAIRRVARRFGLRYGRARAHITRCVAYELRPRVDAVSAAGAAASSLNAAPTDAR
jgi:hypothetical protein